MSVQFQDYYKTLGVSKTASAKEIQGAFRKLARKYHPDVNKAPDAETKFKEINEAHEVLKDPEKRKRYDSLGRHWKAGQSFTPPPGFEDFNIHFGGAGDLGGFSDFFQSIFGDPSAFSGRRSARRGAPRRRRGSDQEVQIEVTLEDVALGAKRTIQLERQIPDQRGAVRSERSSYEVTIPKGVTEGSRIRLAHQGEQGLGGAEAGDLYLRIRLRPDPRFKVQGHDLTSTLNLSPWETALGAQISVPTLEGPVTMKIPAGTPGGRVFRLRGKGLPRRRGQQGDLLVTIRVLVPEALSPREKELFEKLAQESSFQPRG